MKLDIEKTTVIEAPVSKVRTLIEDFDCWSSWSPWTVLEPDIRWVGMAK